MEVFSGMEASWPLSVMEIVDMDFSYGTGDSRMIVIVNSGTSM